MAQLERNRIRIATVTVSDTRTTSDDTGGKLLRELLATAGFTLAGHAIVPDEPDLIRDGPAREHRPEVAANIQGPAGEQRFLKGAGKDLHVLQQHDAGGIEAGAAELDGEAGASQPGLGAPEHEVGHGQLPGRRDVDERASVAPNTSHTAQQATVTRQEPQNRSTVSAGFCWVG